MLKYLEDSTKGILPVPVILYTTSFPQQQSHVDATVPTGADEELLTFSGHRTTEGTGRLELQCHSKSIIKASVAGMSLA